MKTAKEMLQEIVDFLNMPGGLDRDGEPELNKEAINLWAVLSALRGPDNDVQSEPDNYLGRVKIKSTARLRHAIGLKHNMYFVTNHKPLVFIEDYKDGGYHFASHYNLALQRLQTMGFEVEKREEE